MSKLYYGDRYTFLQNNMSKLYYGDRYTFLQNNKGQNLYYDNRYTPYKQNIKFYIAEPKTPLDNQLQYKNHIVRNYLSPGPANQELKEILDTQKSPQPDVTVGKSTG